MDEFLKRIGWISDNGGQIRSKVMVKGASRLTFKDGTASEAILVTFVAEKQEYMAEVLRCFRCHRYGHIKRECKAKQEVCKTCGRQDHSTSGCKSAQRKYRNCGEGAGGTPPVPWTAESEMSVDKQAKGRKLHAQGPCLPTG